MSERREGRTRSVAEVRVLEGQDSPDLVFFSSVSENTLRFVEKLERPAVRIPLLSLIHI